MVRLAEEHGTDLAQYRPLLFHGKEFFHERYNSNVVNHRPQQVLLLHLGATVSYEIFLSLWIVWLHVAAIETVVSQINTFASSTGDFNIITLDHMKKLENLLSLRTPAL